MKKIWLLFISLIALSPQMTKAQSPLNLSQGSGTFINLAGKEDTKGSRYLFDTWVKGSVTDSKGNVIKNDSYGFNYDKIDGTLLLTEDKQNAIAVSKDAVKSFTVFDKSGEAITFDYVPDIDPTHFVQVLSAGGKYKIYKLTKTTLVKANFKSDGMTSSGNKYDEYVDEPLYYVTDMKAGKPQKITLKGKAIKQAFAADADRVKQFFADHADDDINEKFLAGLGGYLNQ